MANEQENQETNSQEFQNVAQSVNEVLPPQEQFFRQKSSPIGSEQLPSKLDLLKDFFVECKRVLLITKKPDKQELKTIIKVSGLGMLIIGVIGFLINMAKELLLK